MDADGTEGQAQRVQRRGQLINSNLFRTNCSRKEYSIKKAYNPAQKACGSEKESTTQDGFFMFHGKPTVFFQFMQYGGLTEPDGSAIFLMQNLAK